MSFMPDSLLRFMADRWIAADFPGLSPSTMRIMSDIHRCRGELLSALQYEEMAEEKEVEGGEGRVPTGP